MTLAREHLEYPGRQAGLDHSWFSHQSLPARPPLHWPGGARVALWVTVHVDFFPMSMTAQPIRPLGAMERGYPDFWTFTHRDYGNRIGIYRVMRVLDRLGIRATAAMNSKVAVRYPALLDEILRRQWEVVASGTDMGHLIHGGLSPEAEKDLIATSAGTLRKLTGQKVQGWHSPSRSQSMRTFEMLAEAKFEYVSDWINDDLPYEVKTSAGRLCAMPLTHERSDAVMFLQYGQTPADYEAQQAAAFKQLHAEGERGGRIFSMSLNPWIIGQAHRIRTLERVLTSIVHSPAVWKATGAEVLDAIHGQS